jgi:hypothetical protein
VILFRHADTRRPFFWESSAQPQGRWHGDGEGPVQYLADTPDGAWAEFLRHEEIVDAEDLQGVERNLWAVEVPDAEYGAPSLPVKVMTGGRETYARCQREARRLRAAGADRLAAPCAALIPSTPSGWRTDGGLVRGDPRDERTWGLFGRIPQVVAWAAGDSCRPRADLIDRVNHF